MTGLVTLAPASVNPAGDLPIDAAPTLTHDYVHRYRGYYEDGAVCRVRIFRPAGLLPVLLVTELPENQNTSVTNMAEYLAADLLIRHFSAQKPGAPAPVWYVEHYPHAPEDARRPGNSFDVVAFARWTPEPSYVFGHGRMKLGLPSWHPIGEDELAALVGMPKGGAS